MQNPREELRGVIKSIVEPKFASEIHLSIDKYFTHDARIIHPMLNSPAAAGREGLKSAYTMLKVLTYGNRMSFHAITFANEAVTRKGKERLVAMLDCTEDLQLRFLPLPDALNPVFHPRFLVRVDMEREIGEGELWRISQQEDNLPTDLGRSGLPLLVLGHISDAAKYFAGVATLIVGGTFSRFNLV